MMPNVLRVTVIRDRKEFRGIVRHPEKRPWSVVREPAKIANGEKAIQEPTSAEHTPEEEIEWAVVIFLDTVREPLVFGTRQDARDWTSTHREAKGFNWDVLNETGAGDDRALCEDAAVRGSQAATARLAKFAQSRPTSLEESIEAAHREGVIGSLTLFRYAGCQPEFHVVEHYLGDWNQLGLAWHPSSCKGSGQSTLYADTYGWNKPGAKMTPVCGSACRADLPLDVKSVKVEH
jgi:hypothetical protein